MSFRIDTDFKIKFKQPQKTLNCYDLLAGCEEFHPLKSNRVVRLETDVNSGSRSLVNDPAPE
ncbi:MAG: hypothetical protein BroJett042_04800 [Bacteroidota bacterium]|nr:MAG: hypothetical protein BroJett042_04800 [Bacteroidota bacterium]